MSEDLPKLTIKQKRFLKYYLEDPTNATEAARRAGYSPKSCSVIAHELLKKTSFLPHLNKALETSEYDYGLEPEDLVKKIEGIAETNIFDLIDIESGRAIVVKDIADIPYEMGQFIQSLKETPQGVEVKFYDKMKALDMLAKIKNMYNLQEVAGTLKVIIDKDDERV